MRRSGLFAGVTPTSEGFFTLCKDSFQLSNVVVYQMVTIVYLKSVKFLSNFYSWLKGVWNGVLCIDPSVIISVIASWHVVCFVVEFVLFHYLQNLTLK